MSQSPDQSGDLQFDSAERTGGEPTGTACVQCKKAIASEYYEAAGHVVCPSCKRNVEAQQAALAQSGSVARALIFGLVAAAAGAALYYGVRAVTGWEIGLIAIVVGYMVGYAVRAGGGGLGGRRFQVLALTLTYLSIGATYVPYVLRNPAADSSTEQASRTDSLPFATDPVAGVGAAGPAAEPTLVGAVMGVGALVLLALVMPVLAGLVGLPTSLISLLITGFALHQAWRMTGASRVVFTGPYQVGATPPAGGSSGG